MSVIKYGVDLLKVKHILMTVVVLRSQCKTVKDGLLKDLKINFDNLDNINEFYHIR
ncbi:MAG: hypothetical protein GY787_28960 [Alteromonadales bacterium]|nr:hypothetical protein [Alteromonadales bacterium]